MGRHVPSTANLWYSAFHVSRGTRRSLSLETAKEPPGYAETLGAGRESSRMSASETSGAGSAEARACSRWGIPGVTSTSSPPISCFFGCDAWNMYCPTSACSSDAAEANSAPSPRQHLLRCAAAAPAVSPMMSSHPHFRFFHICTSSPGLRLRTNPSSGSNPSGERRRSFAPSTSTVRG